MTEIAIQNICVNEMCNKVFDTGLLPDGRSAQEVLPKQGSGMLEAACKWQTICGALAQVSYRNGTVDVTKVFGECAKFRATHPD